MNTFRVRALVALAALCASFSAQSGEGISYIGVSYAWGEVTSGDDSGRPAMVMARIGSQVSPWLAVEGRVSTGVATDTLDVDGTGTRYGLAQSIGMAATVGFANHSQFYPYALVGVARNSSSLRGEGTVRSSDVMFGGGMHIGLTERVDLHIEYTDVLNNDALRYEQIAAGFAWWF